MIRKQRSDKGKKRGPRNKSTEVKDYQLESVRARHIFCISQGQVEREVRQGRIPNYDPRRHFAHCDHREDGFCAAPDVSDDDVVAAIQEQRTKVA